MELTALENNFVLETLGICVETIDGSYVLGVYI